MFEMFEMFAKVRQLKKIAKPRTYRRSQRSTMVSVLLSGGKGCGFESHRWLHTGSIFFLFQEHLKAKHFIRSIYGQSPRESHYMYTTQVLLIVGERRERIIYWMDPKWYRDEVTQ